MQKISKDKKYWQAVGVMIGYIVGVGMFGLPFLTAKTGVAVLFFYLLVLGFAQYLIHMIYANLIYVTEDFHRLPGYAGVYLGQSAKRIVLAAKLLGNYGALLAYIIISGSFLHELLSPILGGTEFIYAVSIYALEALIVFFGIGMIARFELYMSGFLLLVVVLIAVRGHGFMEMSNINFAVDWKYIILPYGAMLFALDGNGSLPIVARLVKKDREKFRSVVKTGMFFAAFITIIFTLTIVSISGAGTTENALTGIRAVLGNGISVLALIFGIIAMATSTLGVAESLKETLSWDFQVNKNLAWFLAVSVPLLFYVLGFVNLINVISFAGAIAGGFCAIMLLIIFLKISRIPDKLAFFDRKPAAALVYAHIGMLVAGIVYSLYYFIG